MLSPSEAERKLKRDARDAGLLAPRRALEALPLVRPSDEEELPSSLRGRAPIRLQGGTPAPDQADVRNSAPRDTVADTLPSLNGPLRSGPAFIAPQSSLFPRDMSGEKGGNVLNQLDDQLRRHKASEDQRVDSILRNLNRIQEAVRPGRPPVRAPAPGDPDYSNVELVPTVTVPTPGETVVPPPPFPPFPPGLDIAPLHPPIEPPPSPAPTEPPPIDSPAADPPTLPTLPLPKAEDPPTQPPLFPEMQTPAPVVDMAPGNTRSPRQTGAADLTDNQGSQAVPEAGDDALVGEAAKSFPTGTITTSEAVDRVSLADSLYAAGRLPLALQIYREVADTETSDGKVWVNYQIANSLRRLRQADEAEKVYREVAAETSPRWIVDSAKWWLATHQRQTQLRRELEQINNTLSPPDKK
ncbi:MAG: tetratricopeptide repeat protein [Planctomycetales bacterium]|nr:tetratricopeptide repeat protein [Planctomycetales bacterium]